MEPEHEEKIEQGLIIFMDEKCTSWLDLTEQKYNPKTKRHEYAGNNARN